MKAVISLSGGLDSTCLLMHLLANGYDEIRAYSFDYGQKHTIELKKVKKNIKYLQKKGYNVTHQVINLRDVFSDSASSLHKGGTEIPKGHYADENMKSTVVENRNVIFSAIIYGKALGWANKTGDNVVITLGIHAGDHCFTGDTKIFTPIGYKTIDQLKVGDPVYSVNDENEITLDTVTDLVKVGSIDEIFNIVTTTGQLRVTGDHRLYKLNFYDFDRSKGYKKQRVEVRAKDIKEGDYLLTSCNLHTTNIEHTPETIDIANLLPDCFKIDQDWVYLKETNKCPRYISIAALVELMAWYITEGWTSKRFENDKNSSKYSSSFSQSLWKNAENCDSIQQMFKTSGIPVKYQFSKIVENNIPKEITYYMSGAISAILSTAGAHAQEKHIPDWLFNILLSNPSLIQLFIDTMVAGDGHYDTNSGMYSYITKSTTLAEDFSFFIKLTNQYVKIYKNKTGCYVLQWGNLSRKPGLVKFGDLASTKVIGVNISNDAEYVYDISVKNNHNFFGGEFANILMHNCIYPDCRPESHEAAKHLFEISNWNSEAVDYIAPFENIDKGDVLKAGIQAMKSLGFTKAGIKTILKNTHTCYNPDEQGRSCGECGSCRERLEAFEKNDMEDPIEYIALPVTEKMMDKILSEL